MKLGVLVSPAFNEGLKALMKAKVPEKTSYWIAKKIKKIQKEQEIYSKLHGDKVKSFAAKDEKGEPVANDQGLISVLPENAAEYNKQIQEILDVEVTDIEPIKLDSLGDKHGLTPGDFCNLAEFIAEE